MEMTSSKLIRANGQSDGYVPWNVPDVHVSASDDEDGLNEIQRQARDRGYAEGRAAGLAAGEQEVTQTIAALKCVLQALARPLDELDVRVEDEIVALVKAVSGQLVRREFKLEPSHIIGLIREGLAALPLSSDEPVVNLHPSDAEVVRSCLNIDDEDCAWRIETDPVIQQGSCVITVAESRVDCRLETRLARVMATMFDGERADDERADDERADDE